MQRGSDKPVPLNQDSCGPAAAPIAGRGGEEQPGPSRRATPGKTTPGYRRKEPVSNWQVATRRAILRTRASKVDVFQWRAWSRPRRCWLNRIARSERQIRQSDKHLGAGKYVR